MCQLPSFVESSNYWQGLGSNAVLKTSSSASAYPQLSSGSDESQNILILNGGGMPRNKERFVGE